MMNNRLTLLFPGQGSQYVGMMRDIYEASPESREILDAADDLLGYKLSSICFEGPADALQQTENTQPAIFLHSYILLKLLRKGGLEAEAAAGHSLGEYSALVAAGALRFEDALRLVHLRGKLMQKAGEDQPGTMAAIIGLDPDTVTSICKTARESGIIQPANFNAPGQIVISGSVEGVSEAMKEAQNRGARMVKELTVSGAFHSPLMQSAQEELGEALKKTDIKRAGIPVYANVTGRPAEEPESVRSLLREQIVAPIKWEDGMKNMIADGSKNFLEVGPGKVLKGLLKRIDPSVVCEGVDTFDEVSAALESLNADND